MAQGKRKEFDGVQLVREIALGGFCGAFVGPNIASYTVREQVIITATLGTGTTAMGVCM